MKAVIFPESNVTLRGNGETVSDLRVYTDGRCCVSVWEMSDDEFAEFAKTRKLYVTLYHPPSNFPPIAVHVESNLPTLPLFKP